jgi:hypothetical protein
MAVLEQVLSLTERSKNWLQTIKKGILSIRSSRKKKATCTQPLEEPAMAPPVPLRKEPVMKSPKRTAKTTVNLSEDWLSSTFRDLGMDPHAWRVAEAMQRSAAE